MLSYTGTSNVFNHTIQIPQDNVDFVDAGTVDPAFMVLADSAHYVARGISGNRPHVSMRWLSNSTIQLSSFGPVSVASTQMNPLWWLVEGPTSPTTLGTGNLESGSMFSNNTAYYVYLKVSVAGLVTTAQYEISLSAPDAALRFKSVAGVSQFTHRYLGHFVTDGTANIRQFTMVDFKYIVPQRLLGDLDVDSVTPIYTDVEDFTVIPPIPGSQVKTIMVKADVHTNDLGLSDLRFQPKDMSGQVRFDFGNPSSARVPPATDFWTYILEVPLFTDNKFTGTLNLGATGNIHVDLYMIGYQE